jgi:AraC-like DNA-binding protein
MDVLSEILSTLRLGSAMYGACKLTAPWGLSAAVADGAAFQVVMEGECWLEVEGVPEPLLLRAGDVTLVTSGREFVLRDAPSSAVRPLAELFATKGNGACGVSYGGGGARTMFVSGCFHFESGGSVPLIRALPPVIHIRAARALPWLDSTLSQIRAEVQGTQPGREAVLRRLSDILFVQIVRAHLLADANRDSGWLRAITDANLGPALAAIHAAPERNWTVASLASEAGMSRSLFAARFSAVLHQTPMQYLTALRMERAADLLREGQTIAAVATRVGYDAESAFAKAFKKLRGLPPGEFRARGAGAHVS